MNTVKAKWVHVSMLSDTGLLGIMKPKKSMQQRLKDLGASQNISALI